MSRYYRITFPGSTNSIISLNKRVPPRIDLYVLKACRKIIRDAGTIEIIFHGLYTDTPRSALATCTSCSFVCENLFAWDIRHAFSILERGCNVGSFDLANEATFKLSDTQMVMIIIII